MTLALTLLLAVQVGAAPVQAPTVTVRVTPEAPAIGEPITVELRVRAPAGAEVRFPVLPDTGSRLEPLDPRALRERPDADGVDRSAVYRLIAWDTGAVALPFGDVTVRSAGVERRYAVTLPDIRVRSVLPADTAQRRPRPARDALDLPSGAWRWWLALAVVLGFAAWIWYRRRRQRSHTAPRRDALAAARQGFAHVDDLRLLEAGEPGRHALMGVRVLRLYLADRWQDLPPSLTATELDQRLRAVDFPILPERVTELVRRAEQLAYARSAIGSEEADTMTRVARAAVEDVERAWRARQERMEAQVAAARRRGRRSA